MDQAASHQVIIQRSLENRRTLTTCVRTPWGRPLMHVTTAGVSTCFGSPRGRPLTHHTLVCVSGEEAARSGAGEGAGAADEPRGARGRDGAAGNAARGDQGHHPHPLLCRHGCAATPHVLQQLVLGNWHSTPPSSMNLPRNHASVAKQSRFYLSFS